MKLLMLEAKKLIDEYCRNEFENSTGADFSDWSNINVATTTTEDGKYEIEAYVDLVTYRIVTLVDGKEIRVEKYKSLQTMVDDVLPGLSFDDLVYLSEKELEEVYSAGKPRCNLIGEDGNIFNLMSRAGCSLRLVGKNKEADEMCKRIRNAKSYDEALTIIGDYVIIC